MKNNTLKSISGLRFNGFRKKAYCGRKSLSKQTGRISNLMLLILISGIAYGTYVANNKGIITYDKVSTVANNVKSAFSNTHSADNDFSGYGVQLMATKQLDQAKTVMNDFARDGYSAFVIASESKGRTLYKVRLGPYTHKPEALAIRDKVVQRYPQSTYVESSLVIYKPH
jgi:hypothetical protein